MKKRAVAASFVLIVFSNSITAFIYFAGVDRQPVYLLGTVFVLCVLYWWARHSARLDRVELGLSASGWKRSAAIGVLVGCLLAIPPLVFLTFPFLLVEPARYREIQNLSLPGLLWRLGVELTIATALVEEVLFRGILQALFKRSLSTARALVATNTVFALWHLAVNAQTLQQNALALPFIPAALAQAIGYLGSLITVGIGGIVLSILRERTNHLAGSMVAHWVVVAAMTVAVYWQ